MTQRTRGKFDLEAALNSDGWTRDRFGNYKKTIDGKEYRAKMQHNTCRMEVRVNIQPAYEGAAGHIWVRKNSAHYTMLKVNEHGQYVIGGITIGEKLPIMAKPTLASFL